MLKYQIFTPSGCKDIGIINSNFMAKTQFFSGIVEFEKEKLSPCIYKKAMWSNFKTIQLNVTQPNTSDRILL